MDFLKSAKALHDPFGIVNSNNIFGKKKKVRADPLAGDINAAASQGLGYVNNGAKKIAEIYNQDPSEFVESQMKEQEKALDGVLADTQRRANDLLSQRGLGKSSLKQGLSLRDKIERDQRKAFLKASRAEYERSVGLDNGQGLMGAGSGMLGLKTNTGSIQMDEYKYRTGGLSGVLPSLIQGGAQLYQTYEERQKAKQSQNGNVALNYNQGSYSNYS